MTDAQKIVEIWENMGDVPIDQYLLDQKLKRAPLTVWNDQFVIPEGDRVVPMPANITAKWAL